MTRARLKRTWVKMRRDINTNDKSLPRLLFHKSINSNDSFQRRRPSLFACPPWCIMCRGAAESIDHLFLFCPVVSKLWQNLFSFSSKQWVKPGCVRRFFEIDFWGLGFRKRVRILWSCAFLAVFWVVWIEMLGFFRTRNLPWLRCGIECNSLDLFGLLLRRSLLIFLSFY